MQVKLNMLKFLTAALAASGPPHYVLDALVRTDDLAAVLAVVAAARDGLEFECGNLDEPCRSDIPWHIALRAALAALEDPKS